MISYEIDEFCLGLNRWENVQEASSSLREGAFGRRVEAGRWVRASLQEGVMEGPVRPEPHP